MRHIVYFPAESEAGFEGGGVSQNVIVDSEDSETVTAKLTVKGELFTANKAKNKAPGTFFVVTEDEASQEVDPS